MPKPKKGPRLGSGPAHQRLMLRNLARSLFENERIQTTESKAKMLRPFAEKLITKAKKGGVHNRRLVLAHIEDRAVVHKLFDDIGPRFSERDGGYTRILKLGPRQGDAAPMALIELVDEGLATTVTESASDVSGRRRLRRPTRRRNADPEAQDQTADSSEPDEEPSAGADAAESATEEPTPAASEDVPAASEDTPVTPDVAESEPSAEATPEAEPADDEDKDS